jgi:hypothetical protein
MIEQEGASDGGRRSEGWAKRDRAEEDKGLASAQPPRQA